MGGRIVSLDDIKPTATALQLKARVGVAEVANLPVEQLGLVFNSKRLDDQRPQSLQEQGVGEGAKIYVATLIPRHQYKEPQSDAHVDLPVRTCVGCGCGFDSGDHGPFLLGCGSNVCASCLPVMHARAIDKHTAICPEPRCHARTILAAGNVDQALERLRNAPLTSAIASGTLGTSGEPEETKCAEHETCGQSATKFCPACNGCYCDDCCEDAHQLRLLRSHVSGIVPLDASAPAPKLALHCPKHYIPLRLSCATCDDVLVCQSCHHFDGAHSGPEHAVEALEVSTARQRAAVEEACPAARDAQERALATSRWAARTFNLLVGEGDARPVGEAEPGSGIDAAHERVHAFYEAVRTAATTREAEMHAAVEAQGRKRWDELQARQAAALAVVARTQTVLAVSAHALVEGDLPPLAGVLPELHAVASAEVSAPDVVGGAIQVEFPEDFVKRVLGCGSVQSVEQERAGACAAGAGVACASCF